MKEKKKLHGTLKQFIDPRCHDGDPKLFYIALTLRLIRVLIQHVGRNMKCPDLEPALSLECLESFVARTSETMWKCVHLDRECGKLHQLLLRAREAWEKGHSLFQEALE